MVKKIVLSILFTFLLSSPALAISVDDVIYLSSAGVEDSIIIAKIEASGETFDLSTEEIIELWEAGVSSEVIEYMIATSAGAPKAEAYPDQDTYYEDDSYYYQDDTYYDDDVVVVRHPRSRVHLYFSFGYYDSWYYPYWWWHRPFYYDAFYYNHYWPYYYHWSPYAYYYPWDCWTYRPGGDIVVGRGIRHHWRRGDPADSYHYRGKSGYKLKPRYTYAEKGARGGYLARDGRYVFPEGKPRGLYADGRGDRDWRYGKDYRSRTGIYRTKRGSDGYLKRVPYRRDPDRLGRTAPSRDSRYYRSRDKTDSPRSKSRVERSRTGRSGDSRGSSVRSSRSRSGDSRSSMRSGRSSGSRSSDGRSSGSRASGRSSRGGRGR